MTRLEGNLGRLDFPMGVVVHQIGEPGIAAVTSVRRHDDGVRGRQPLELMPAPDKPPGDDSRSMSAQRLHARIHRQAELDWSFSISAAA
jgi:hypothetical protein